MRTLTRLILLLSLLSLKLLRADMNAQDMFMKALKEGDANTIESLLAFGFDPNVPVHGYTPLYFAMQSHGIEPVRLLLASHADPNAPVISRGADRFNATPLQFAVQAGNLQTASILISAGAQVNSKGTTGRTALYYAIAVSPNLEMIHFLILKGADINVRDAEGTSPLDEAVWRGSLDMVAILLANGARLNEPAAQTGATPVNQAAFMGNVALVRYLLQFHPDLGIPDKRGYPPLDNAIRRKKEACAELLLEAQPSDLQTPQFLGSTMEAATQRDEPGVVVALLRHGALADGILPSGTTPLDLAAFAGAARVARVLLDRHADPNLSGRNGTTPLEDASLKGFGSIAGLLLDHGARVNQLNSASGTTALYAAASFGKGELVKLLLDRGANPILCGSNRRSPYQAALENGYSEVAAELRSRGGAGNCQQ